MSTRTLLGLGLVLGALALAANAYERRAAGVVAHDAEDMAGIGALIAARTALETSVLESRAGIQLNFDAINQAVLSLRAAPHEAAVVRSRGSAYAEASAALDRISEEMRTEEASIELFKTDLALLRLSSRYFPIAADSLAHQGDTTSKQLALLRSDVERFEEAPSREIAQRLEAEIPALEAVRASLDEARRGDLDVLLGHTRSILDRRERVDRTVRSIVRSPVRVDAEAARAAYERAARHEAATVLALRIVTAELAVVAIALLAAAAWTARRRSGSRPWRRPFVERVR
jgi:hypothetical protein